MPENQRSYFLFLQLSEQNPPSHGSDGASKLPVLEQAIGKYTTRDDTDLKAGLKASLYKTMATIVKGTFIVDDGDDKARVTLTSSLLC